MRVVVCRYDAAIAIHPKSEIQFDRIYYSTKNTTPVSYNYKHYSEYDIYFVTFKMFGFPKISISKHDSRKTKIKCFFLPISSFSAGGPAGPS